MENYRKARVAVAAVAKRRLRRNQILLVAGALGDDEENDVGGLRSCLHNLYDFN